MLQIFCEFELQLFAAGKLPSTPLLNVFSRNPQEKDRQCFALKELTPGLEPVFQRGAVWAGSAPNLKKFTVTHWASCFLLAEDYLH